MKFLYAIIVVALMTALLPLLNRVYHLDKNQRIVYKLKAFNPTPFEEPKKEKKEIEKKIEKEILLDTQTPKLEFKPTTVHNNISFNSNLQISHFSSQNFVVGKSFQVKHQTVLSKARDAEIIFAPKPIIPLRAKKMGLSGTVKARFTVNVNGTTSDVEIISSTNSIFDKNIIKAISNYKMKPALDDEGHPVTSTTTRTFEIETN